MPRLVERYWPGDTYGSRRERQGFAYVAYVPDPIADLELALPAAATEAVVRATAETQSLERVAASIDLEAVAGPLLRAEALGSSHIEGLRASHKRIAIAAYEPVAADTTAMAVLGNVRAMEQAVAIGGEADRLTIRHLLDIHRTLLEGTSGERYAGRLRTSQNWIGGRPTNPWNAVFVPPPETEVEPLMADLADFCTRDDLPVVAQAAIAHAQFETIHPFADGNGRVGRCLIHILFRRRQLATRFIPPVSVVLATNANAYIGGLTDYRDGRLAQWCGFFADATWASAIAAERLAASIDQLTEELVERAANPRRGSAARSIIAGLPRHPVVSAETAATDYSVSPLAARRALNRLEAAGVLVPTRVGRRRGREWSCDDLFDLLDAFEFDLATPGDGSSPRPSPTRQYRRRTAVTRRSGGRRPRR